MKKTNTAKHIVYNTIKSVRKWQHVKSNLIYKNIIILFTIKLFIFVHYNRKAA